MAAAKVLGRELYIYQCTADTRPEDLLVTPVLAESGKIAYHASPLVTAMLRGGVCLLDEGNRMNEKSASLRCSRSSPLRRADRRRRDDRRLQTTSCA
jgi:MoxR-like ATPase